MQEIHTAIAMKGSPDLVWDVLLDFKRYPEWNPFCVEVQGEVGLNNVIQVRIRSPKGSERTLDCTVKRFDPPHELTWAWCIMTPLLYCGQHHFEISSLFSGGVRFSNNEEFGGLLVPLFAHSVRTDTRQGFEAMNQALKARVEALA